LLHHRRFVSSEETNYTLEDVYGQYFILLFLIIFSISLSDKVFLFRHKPHPTRNLPAAILICFPFFLSYGLKITKRQI
ncbi:hypothetical protein, partial [Neisseria meningitidis]|uniref:hypothetical protein n=1 Tax=Neisseria meningitidis TaxID=487 RepID=UPI001C705361